MEYGLARRLPVRLVYRQPLWLKRVADRACDTRRGTQHGARLAVIERVQILRMPLHRHEYVARVDLAKVHERERLVVFVHHGGGNLPRHDPAEHAIAHPSPPGDW